MFIFKEEPSKIIESARINAGIESAEEFREMVNNGDENILKALKDATKEVMNPVLNNMSKKTLADLRVAFEKDYVKTVELMDRWRFENQDLYVEKLTGLYMGQYVNEYINKKETTQKLVGGALAGDKPKKGIAKKIKDFIFGEDN